MSFTGLMFIIGSIALYILPSIIASQKDKKNKDAITILNLLIGWTVIGWIISLVWACMED